MRNFKVVLPLFITALITSSIALGATPQVKDWTFMTYLNGNNNLDSFGTTNLQQMETVGSNDKLNIVVQWASESRGSTQRLLVQKSTNPANLTSPVIQDLGKVDMGDYHSLVDFVQWSVTNFPAKHYFLNIWDHGAGWHRIELMGTGHGFKPLDISFDEVSGNHITTEQLSQSIATIAQIIGHHLDIYGSDACLMAMAEVADEMAGNVDVYSGSEETEPGAGWPYDTFLAKWVANPDATSVQIGGYLTDAYTASYQGGTNGSSDVTFSTFDLSKTQALTDAVSKLSAKFLALSVDEKSQVMTAAKASQAYAYADYVDMQDFLNQMQKTRVFAGSPEITNLSNAITDFVTDTKNTTKYANSHGVSFWLPTDSSTYSTNADRYNALRFAKDTHWGDVLKALLGTAHNR